MVVRLALLDQLATHPATQIELRLILLINSFTSLGSIKVQKFEIHREAHFHTMPAPSIILSPNYLTNKSNTSTSCNLSKTKFQKKGSIIDLEKMPFIQSLVDRENKLGP